MDSMTFLKPVYIGNALILKARINYVKRSSMEVQVDIEAEDLNKSQKVHTGTAYVTLVALDEKGKPIEVPKLFLQNKEEQDRYLEGETRMELRLRNRKKKKE
jgi:acyl-CoA hydrolase